MDGGIDRPMRIATWNVNGLRAAVRKDLGRHLEALDADVVLVQEVRAKPNQLPWTDPPGYAATWHPAERPGYAGVATWTARGRPARFEVVGVGMDGELDPRDPDGRVLHTRVDDIDLVNVYAPSGSAGPESQARKDAFLERFLPYATRLVAQTAPVVLAGDLNIAPTELDIHDPRANKRNSGFLPHERAAFQALLDAGWVDLVRTWFGPVQGPYSWWSARGRARELDRGWRIDHVLGNTAAAARLVGAGVHRDGRDASDHAPVWVALG